MKIVFIASSYPRYPGDGTAPFVKSIAEALAYRGHQVVVVAPFDAECQPSAGEMVPVHRFRYAPRDDWHILGHARSLVSDVRLRGSTFFLLPFFIISGTAALISEIKKQPADVIYAHWVIPGGLIALIASWITHVPFALSIHGSDVYVARKNPLFGWIAGVVFRRATHVTACSEDLRQGAIQLGAPADVQLVAWGADPERFTPRPQPEAAPVSPAPLHVITLGRMVKKKGFDCMLHSLSAVARDVPQLHARLGGDGPERGPLQLLAAQLGLEKNVEFSGRVPWDQVPEFLASGDIFLLPSVRDPAGNQDGLPTVLLEAMACGLAVVASDIGGVNLVIRDGVNGLLVPPGDANALAAAVTELIENPSRRRQLACAARQSVVDEFNWRTVAQKIESLLIPAQPKM